MLKERPNPPMSDEKEKIAKISCGRILYFLLLTLGGGLLQLWTLALIFYATDKPLGVSNLLGDGGLFFFSTSLACTSFRLLHNYRELRFGSADSILSIILAGSLTFISVVCYTTVLSPILSGAVKRPAILFANHLYTQVGCATAAITYALYVASVTKVFRREKK
jgi:hypothetical protein